MPFDDTTATVILEPTDVAAGEDLYADLYLRDISNLIMLVEVLYGNTPGNSATLSLYDGYGGKDPELVEPWAEPIPKVVAIDDRATTVVTWDVKGQAFTLSALDSDNRQSVSIAIDRKAGADWLSVVVSNPDGTETATVRITGRVL